VHEEWPREEKRGERREDQRIKNKKLFGFDSVSPLNALERASSQLWKNSFSVGGDLPDALILP